MLARGKVDVELRIFKGDLDAIHPVVNVAPNGIFLPFWYSLRAISLRSVFFKTYGHAPPLKKKMHQITTVQTVEHIMTPKSLP